MSESEITDLISKGFNVLDIAWGAALDKVNGLPLGTTLVTKYGVLASTFGGLAATQKFASSQQQSSDLDQFALDISAELPGLPGIAMTGVAWVHEQLGKVFDGSTNERALLDSIIMFSDSISRIPAAASNSLTSLISQLRYLSTVDYNSLQNNLTIRQYSMSGGEVITYQFTDEYGISYNEMAHVSGVLGDVFETTLPAITVSVSRSGDLTPDLPMVDGLYTVDLTNATLINATTIYANSSQFDNSRGFLANTVASNLNSFEFTQSLLQSAGLSNVGFVASGSKMDILSDVTGYLTTADYTYLMDPYLNDAFTISSAVAQFFQSQSGYSNGWPDNATTDFLFMYDILSNQLGNANSSCNLVMMGIPYHSVNEYIDGISVEYANYGSPIALDLNGDGLKTTSLHSQPVRFDINGDGRQEWTGWLSGDDGFLAVDKNKNGSIDGVSELFGGAAYGEGYAKLANYDSNNDFVIDGNDKYYDSLVVWRDSNIDGITNSGEINGLSEAGISQLSLDYKIVNWESNGNIVGEQSTAVVNNNSREMGDIYFKYYRSTYNYSNSPITIMENKVPVSAPPSGQFAGNESMRVGNDPVSEVGVGNQMSLNSNSEILIAEDERPEIKISSAFQNELANQYANSSLNERDFAYLSLSDIGVGRFTSPSTPSIDENNDEIFKRWQRAHAQYTSRLIDNQPLSFRDESYAIGAHQFPRHQELHGTKISMFCVSSTLGFGGANLPEFKGLDEGIEILGML